MRALVASLLLLAACGGNELVIGTEPEFPPFESKNEKGEFVGFDMDMARMLAKDLGRELRIEEMAFDSLPTALQNGQIDLIISGMTNTPERARNLDFSDTYFETGLCLLVNAASGIEKASDADGKRFVVKLGTTGEKEAPRLFPNATITSLETEGACALEVIHGRADAFLYDQLSVIQHQRKNPGTTRALLAPLTHEPYAMAVRKGNRELLAQVNAFLAKIRADGRYARLREQYLRDLPDDAR
ncbi:MAG: transporter substrate-binding domain-containing protein [Planctomycetes bacterium]|nr:transporter substrate-binding domain-containing protein [Planctomycetota bacterium]